jgi:hypothetical protein
MEAGTAFALDERCFRVSPVVPIRKPLPDLARLKASGSGIVWVQPLKGAPD